MWYYICRSFKCQSNEGPYILPNMKMNDMKMNANSDRRTNKIIKIKSVKLTYFGLYSNSKRYRNCHVENKEASLSACCLVNFCDQAEARERKR
jgi:hypothetical protein